MLKKTIKRFYKQACFAESAAGYAITLDGKPVKTPAGKPLEVPARALAEAIAAEWEGQGAEVRPNSMPLTQLASTALDRVGPERAAIIEQMVGYAGTDLLCYRADYPPDLVLRQTRGWQPLLDWAGSELGANLDVTEGVIAIEQPPAALAALEARLSGCDVWKLTAVQSATAAAGSLVLALALTEGRLTGTETFELSQLDETFQIEQWGEDAEATQRRAILKRDIAAAERLLALVV